MFCIPHPFRPWPNLTVCICFNWPPHLHLGNNFKKILLMCCAVPNGINNFQFRDFRDGILQNPGILGFFGTGLVLNKKSKISRDIYLVKIIHCWQLCLYESLRQQSFKDFWKSRKILGSRDPVGALCCATIKASARWGLYSSALQGHQVETCCLRVLSWIWNI